MILFVLPEPSQSSPWKLNKVWNPQRFQFFKKIARNWSLETSWKNRSRNQTLWKWFEKGVQIFAYFVNIEINVIDSDHFVVIILTANKGKTDKIYLLKEKNHFDVIKSMTAFLDVRYYCHECKKIPLTKEKHKCPSKCLSFFFSRIMSRWIRPFHALQKMPHIFQPKMLWQSQKQSLWQSTKKCLKCEKIISWKFVEGHLCGFFRRLKLQEICSQRTSLMCHEKKLFKGAIVQKTHHARKKICCSCRRFSKKCPFFDFECRQETGTHIVNLTNFMEMKE